MKLRYFLLYKPYGVLCRFSGWEDRKTLAHFGPFPGDVYPAGRLDMNSEGLVLLTNDGALIHRLLEPRYGHVRTYLAQVERVPSEEALEKLRRGVFIEKRRTRPAGVRLLKQEPRLPEREIPIRFRKSVPTAWLRIRLREGRNRQVRRMTAAVGHPTLRLVRVAIGGLKLEELQPGESRELTEKKIMELRGKIL
jgi:23S rRNA pseudouridine2457 synthase